MHTVHRFQQQSKHNCSEATLSITTVSTTCNTPYSPTMIHAFLSAGPKLTANMACQKAGNIKDLAEISTDRQFVDKE
jgi:hypothetical protein